MKKALLSSGLCWLWLVPVVVALDLTSKQWIVDNLFLYEVQPVISHFNLFYTHNYGAAFSFLADKGGWQRWFFSGVAIAIVVVLLITMYRSQACNRLKNIACSLIIGGASGNLFDRAYHGFVIDFVDFYIGNWHFATFNIADCAITTGALLIIAEGFLTPSEKQVDEKG